MDVTAMSSHLCVPEYLHASRSGNDLRELKLSYSERNFGILQFLCENRIEWCLIECRELQENYTWYRDSLSDVNSLIDERRVKTCSPTRHVASDTHHRCQKRD